MLEHGGRLNEAARRFGIPREQWLDLSTGIAPWSYPLPAAPSAIWQRLPEDDDGLEEVARKYYGAPHIIALPGSQAAIQALPRFFPAGRVALPQPIYAEHPAAWRAAGHSLVDWGTPSDYAVLCNPNNPTGQRYARDELLALAGHVQFLVIDEAFIDAEPAESLANHAVENIVVLRSLGKFFGLAGVRIGFAIAAPSLLGRLRAYLGSWAVSHPARWAARRALTDSAWQTKQRERLAVSSRRLAALLSNLGEPTGCALFQTVVTSRAAELHEALARRGILVRRFDAPPALRFGLPAAESDWERLERALREVA